jgi:NOL1/NOP2/sun family putative RNA methylase
MLDTVSVEYLTRRYQQIVPNWHAFMNSLKEPLPTTLWIQTERVREEDLVTMLQWPQAGIRPLRWRPHAMRVPASWLPGRQPEYIAGFYHLQEEVSMLPVHLLDPQPAERILDLCAAPGNKTMQAALAVGPSGTVVANDWSVSRMKVLRLHAARLGLANIVTTISNGMRFQAQDASFDRVLVDAPCSCEGTLRKNPNVIRQSKLTTGQLHYGGAQIALAKRAWRCLKPGGRMVYATCTFRPEENEYVIDRLLSALPDIEVMDVEVPGFAFSPGLDAWNGQTFGQRCRKTMRIWPQQNDTGGFYVAVLEKLA